MLFLPAAVAFTEAFVTGNPVQYERYIRMRSTATRLEASRRPRTPTATNPSLRELAGSVSSIASPMHVIVGDRDWLFAAAEHLHALVPGSELTVLPGSPHNAYFEAPDAYNGALRAFLARVVD